MLSFDSDRYVANRDAEVPRRFDAARAVEAGDLETWQHDFRAALADLTGLTDVTARNARLPLEPRAVGVESFPSYTREKWYVQTEPGLEIPFYLLLPLQGEGPYPLALTPHGHGRRGKEVYVGAFESEEEERDSLAGDRDVARQAVEAGYAVIAMDVRGFWEMALRSDVEQQNNNSCTEMQKRAYLYGRTLIGERVHDMGRLIDYAATRPEIDTTRIVITGNSGGGTISLFTAALDPRISVAVPGSYLNTFHDSLMSISHCLCNFVPGILHLGELYDVAALIAPRPVLFVNGAQDPIYPSSAAQEAFGHVQHVYAALGAADRCALFLGDGGHRYYKDPVWPFVAQHL